MKGNGNVVSQEFKVDDYSKMSFSGAGNVTIAVEESLTGKVSGSGKLNYKGDPATVQVDISGAGRLKKSQLKRLSG